MLELDAQHYRLLKELRDHPENSDGVVDREFGDLLEKTYIFTDEKVTKNALMRKRYQRNSICFDSAYLDLTICPTFACNFRCPYCFESSQEESVVMSPETIERLIVFIKRFVNAKTLSLTWFGGEPTLSFNTIKTLTKRLQELKISFDKVVMFTNGYLLDKEKIEQLNSLMIENIQITLDGSASTHDSRRVLTENRPTFEKILANIETLMNSSYEGNCTIRVNIDKKNMTDYVVLRLELLKRFKSNKFSVYPAQVHTSAAQGYDHNCTFCANEWADFTLDLYEREGIIPKKGFYPGSHIFNTCIANNQNGYVIGPEGELYKCWEDIGKNNMIIGSLHDKEPVYNTDLIALYSIGTDPFDDDECMDCAVLPICGGGCVNRRLRAKHFKEKDITFCSSYKEKIVSYLEAFYDVFSTNDICSNILDTPKTVTMYKGYHQIQL